MNSESNSDNVTNIQQFLICPYCIKDIPIITFDILPGILLVKIQCSCSNEIRELTIQDFIHKMKTIKPIPEMHYCNKHSQQAIKFNISTSLWICSSCQNDNNNSLIPSSLIDYEVNLICLKHNNSKYAYYCKECHYNLCKQCLIEHIKHEWIPIIENPYIELLKLSFFIFQKINSEKKIVINDFINELHKKMLNNSNEQELSHLKNLEKDIMKVYDDNITICKYFEDYARYFYFTISLIQEYPCYQITRILRTSILNNFPLIPKGDIWQCYQKIKEFLLTNFIMIQSKEQCIATLSNNNSEVTCLLQLNNEQLASGYHDGIIKIWSLNLYENVTIIQSHLSKVTCLLLFKNTLQFISSSDDETIKFWSLVSFTCNQTIKINHSILCMTLLNNSNDDLLIIGLYNFTIEVWNLTGSTSIKKDTFKRHLDKVSCLLELRSKQLASGSYDNSIIIWNISTGDIQHKLQGHLNHITCLLQLNDGQLASSSKDKTIRLWDTKTFSCNTILVGHTWKVSFLLLSKNGLLMSTSEDGKVKEWNKNTYTFNSFLANHKGSIDQAIFITNGMLATASDDKTIKLWKL